MKTVWHRRAGFRVWGVVFVLLSGCQGKDMESVGDRARLETEAELELQSANRTQRAREMESDLAIRHRFYQAVRGVYEGEVETESGNFKIRLTLTPSRAPYQSSRVRSLEEIIADLTSLHFNLQIVQWHPSNALSAVGCRASGVQPDLHRGEIEVNAEGCGNVYRLRLADRASSKPGEKLDSARIAGFVLSGDELSVAGIEGEVQPTTNAAVYSFSAAKVRR